MKLFFVMSSVLAVAMGGAPAVAEEVLLNGPWRFAYSNSIDRAYVYAQTNVSVMVEPQPLIPEDDQFALDLQVPGYWDEQLNYIPEAPWGDKVSYYGGSNVHPIRFPYIGSGRPRHPDGGRPYIVGIGWYKKTIDVPQDWDGRMVTLRVGGARIDTYCYVNGVYVDMHHGHDVTFEFEIGDLLEPGTTNEIVLGVHNDVQYINSCALRGYQGNSGGIIGDVTLQVSDGPGRIASYYAYPANDLQEMRWDAELTSPSGIANDTRLVWAVRSRDGGRAIREGHVAVRPIAPFETQRVEWTSDTEGIEPWSTWDPVLHDIEVRWENLDGTSIDHHSRSFGLRQLEQRDGRFFLNGRPIMLRGICEIYFFAPFIHPPNDVEYFKERLLRLKEVGYNQLRFHTWVPQEPYMQAADEVGMLLGPELSSSKPVGPREFIRWKEIVKWCRYHPSVVTYCGGNEEVGHEGLIAKIAERHLAAKALAPDALTIPMHTLSGPEHEGGHAALPVPKHYDGGDRYYEVLWDRISRYSDAFAVRANDFSYSNFLGRDWRQVEPNFTHFDRPIIAHELGIIGTYIDLSLEERYTESLPRDLYVAAREYITSAGRVHMAPTYYENSAKWHGQARKYVTENLRKIDAFDGYDILGAWDSHWHNAGYGCGMLNEFFEFKPGDTLERVLQYNGESVVLLDNAQKHVFAAGESFDMPVMASLYGGDDLRAGTLVWQVVDGDEVLVEGRMDRLDADDGRVTTLGTIAFEWPNVDHARHTQLHVALEGAGYDLTNAWDMWVFPNSEQIAVEAAVDDTTKTLLEKRYTLSPATDAKLRIVSKLTEDELEHLASGGDVLLLGSDPFPVNETRFQVGVAGRAHMNLATVVNDHPALKGIPHEGWADWQFQSLLENGHCVEFNKLPAEFNPIVEIVSSYKYIRLQAAMWEANTEGGRIFGAHMNFGDLTNPAAAAVLDGIIAYVTGDAFGPTTDISIRETLQPLLEGITFKSLKGNDGNYYGGRSLF